MIKFELEIIMQENFWHFFCKISTKIWMVRWIFYLGLFHNMLPWFHFSWLDVCFIKFVPNNSKLVKIILFLQWAILGCCFHWLDLFVPLQKKLTKYIREGFKEEEVKKIAWFFLFKTSKKSHKIYGQSLRSGTIARRTFLSM